MTLSLTRRQVMRLFSMSIPAALLSSVGLDVFRDELICVHVYDLQKPLPQPLLEDRPAPASRGESEGRFQTGLPELLLCRSREKFLDLFQYFWPVTQEEFQDMRKAIEVKLSIPELVSRKDIDELSRYLANDKQLTVTHGVTTAFVLTLNDYTIHWVSEIVRVCQDRGLTEFVVFKDPSKPPYLCRHPAQQKGFKRPPPIG